MESLFNVLLKELLTQKEIKILQQRFQIAQLLKTDLTYREIARRIGISTTTVVRLNWRLKIRKSKREKHPDKKTIVAPKVYLRESRKKLPWVIG